MSADTLHDLFVTLRGLEVSGFGDCPLDTDRGKLRGFVPSGDMKELLILVDSKRSKSITVSEAVARARSCIGLGKELSDAKLVAHVVGAITMLPVEIFSVNRESSGKKKDKIELVLSNYEENLADSILLRQQIESNNV